MKSVRVVDSHTGGEPTRVVVEGAPDFGERSMAERLERFRREHDEFRSAVVNEPRGSDVIVGAVLLEPVDRTAAAGVIYFNNVGYLGMCGHGTIGLIATLAYLGRAGVGRHAIETPVGAVHANLHDDGSVSVENVISWRFRAAVPVEIPGHGVVHGDIAWGGNWFFLIGDHGLPLELGNVERLTQFSWAVRRELERNGIAGQDGQEIDHIELFGPPSSQVKADSRNFVLCPGGAYDRSPCGTGTSAKLACLAADGKLAPGGIWRQESIVGSVFEGSYAPADDGIRPTIRGRAWVNADSTLILDDSDPFQWGIRAR
jgi:4-hydroxyproline epimerase